MVDLFTNIRIVEHGSEKDILDRTYVQVCRAGGQADREFYTPSCVVRTLVVVLHPYQNMIDCKNLANLKDCLLPKLMAGEIDVSGIRS